MQDEETITLTIAEYEEFKKKADILDYLFGDKGVRKDDRNEETFLAKVYKGYRITIYDPVRERLDLELGDLLRVTIHVEKKARGG